VTAASIEFAVFCKAPIAGRVKTRLIPTFGSEQAANFYHAMLLKTLVTVDQACRTLGALASLWIADDIDDLALLDLSRHFNLTRYSQSTGDLQQRASRVVLIGSDCLAFTPQHLIQAANALSVETPWVFTPAEDGGYVLVGTCSVDQTPFRDMRWSEPSVMAETRARLAQASLAWSEMSMLWDVDTDLDVRRAQQLGWL
jgi:uncharacterized protein